MNTDMSERHHRLARPSVALAVVLSCSFVGAAVVGAVTAPFVVAVLGLAAVIGVIGLHERGMDLAEPFSASRRPTVETVAINARRVRDASSAEHSDGHSDVA
ncbi:MAG TPA: hypothetical protein VF711_07345 [Acidimicrobiales bacterium]|jgi:hypothetical protein